MKWVNMEFIHYKSLLPSSATVFPLISAQFHINASSLWQWLVVLEHVKLYIVMVVVYLYFERENENIWKFILRFLLFLYESFSVLSAKLQSSPQSPPHLSASKLNKYRALLIKENTVVAFFNQIIFMYILLRGLGFFNSSK